MELTSRLETFEVVTTARTELIDLTGRIKSLIDRHCLKEGLLVLNILHTTASLIIQEFQAALLEDLKAFFQGLIQDGSGWRHNDPRYSDCERKNAASHLRASLLGQTLALSVSNGQLMLGSWQSVILAEFDGPRSRRINIQILGQVDGALAGIGALRGE